MEGNFGFPLGLCRDNGKEAALKLGVAHLGGGVSIRGFFIFGSLCWGLPV